MNEQIKRLCSDCEAAQEILLRGQVEENEKLTKQLARYKAMECVMDQFLKMFAEKMERIDQYKDVAPDSNLKALALYKRLTAKNFCSDGLAQSPPDGAPGENEEGSGEREHS